MLRPSTIAARAFVIFIFASAGAIVARAQCGVPKLQPGLLPNVPIPAVPAPKQPRPEPVLPEAGFLSNTHYTSQFFGFSFELPLTVQGHEVMLPLMPETQHALLALQFEQGEQRGSITVTADDPKQGDVKIPEARQKEVDEWAKNGTQAGGLPLTPVPEFLVRSNHLHHQFNHRGHMYSAHYWTGIDNYTVNIVVSTNDGQFLRKSKDVMTDMRFYCPQDDGTLAAQDGRPVKVPGGPYYGPTVPTARVNAALHDLPAKDIPPGKVADGVYQNEDVGFRYELPKGWRPLSVGTGDPPLEATALREYQFLHACSRILLEAAPENEKDNPAGGSSIVLRALDPNCLAMRTAVSITDKRTTDEVAASLEDLREFGEIGSDGLSSSEGHLFMVFHGTIATSQRGSDLSHRLSQTIFATRYNKLILLWSVMAPDITTLQQLPTGVVTLGDSRPIQLGAVEPHRAAR
jgi:hypothetical protein